MKLPPYTARVNSTEVTFGHFPLWIWWRRNQDGGGTRRTESAARKYTGVGSVKERRTLSTISQTNFFGQIFFGHFVVGFRGQKNPAGLAAIWNERLLVSLRMRLNSVNSQHNAGINLAVQMCVAPLQLRPCQPQDAWARSRCSMVQTVPKFA